MKSNHIWISISASMLCSIATGTDKNFNLEFNDSLIQEQESSQIKSIWINDDGSISLIDIDGVQINLNQQTLDLLKKINLKNTPILKNGGNCMAKNSK